MSGGEPAYADRRQQGGTDSLMSRAAVVAPGSNRRQPALACALGVQIRDHHKIRSRQRAGITFSDYIVSRNEMGWSLGRYRSLPDVRPDTCRTPPDTPRTPPITPSLSGRSFPRRAYPRICGDNSAPSCVGLLHPCCARRVISVGARCVFRPRPTQKCHPRACPEDPPIGTRDGWLGGRSRSGCRCKLASGLAARWVLATSARLSGCVLTRRS
jgi:hypothetical protein